MEKALTLAMPDGAIFAGSACSLETFCRRREFKKVGCGKIEKKTWKALPQPHLMETFFFVKCLCDLALASFDFWIFLDIKTSPKIEGSAFSHNAKAQRRFLKNLLHQALTAAQFHLGDNIDEPIDGSDTDEY